MQRSGSRAPRAAAATLSSNPRPWLICARRLVGLLLLALVLLVGPGGSRASARTTEDGDCVEVARRKLYLPEQVASDDELSEWAWTADNYPEEVEQADENLLATYCRDGQGWTRSEDNFPYEDADICVTIASENSSTPEEITPLEEINDWGIQNYSDMVPHWTYCRDGDTWKQQRDDTDAPEDCVAVVRNQYEMPDTIEPPGVPLDHGSEASGSYDPSYEVTYCDPEGDGTWEKTEDPFPYDQADLCIVVLYDHEANGDVPAEVTPLGAIDDVARLYARSDSYPDPNLETYCRDGDKWVRQARDDDRPEGDWSEWADGECITIVPIADTPEKLEVHPETRGQVLDDDPFDHNGVRLQFLDPRTLVTYCPHGGLWYRVDDYPLQEIVGDDNYRLDDPGVGTCLVVFDILDEGGEFPEVIVPPGSPVDYGGVLSKETYKTTDAYRDNGNTIPEKQLFCFVNGVWQRGDRLHLGCQGMDDPHIVNPSGILPDECWGRFPTAYYDIGYHGGDWNDWMRKLNAWWADFFFGVGKAATAVALWALGWAYEFDITEYRQLGLNIGHDYQVNITENAAFRLEELTFMVLVGWCAIRVLQRRASMAAGEIVTSMALMAVVGVLMAGRADYMQSIWDVMDESSRDLMVAGQGRDPAVDDTDLMQVVADTQANLHEAFVEDPYDYLNWGHRLTGECATARDEVLALGPPGDSDEPRTIMRDAGCEQEATFNEVPTMTRLLGAALVMVAALFLAVLLLSVSLTVVIAKFVVLALAALLPLLVPVVCLPAGMRRMWWLAVSVALQAVLAVLGTTLLLSLLIVAIEQLMEATDDIGIVERFVVLVLFVFLAKEARKRLLASGQSTAGRLADNLTNSLRLGGGAPWQGPSGSKGIDFLAGDRVVRAGLGGAGAVGYRAGLAGVGAAVGVGAMAGRMVSARWNRHATGKVSLRNLQTMQINQRLADGDPIPVWRGHRAARLAARRYAAGVGSGRGRGVVVAAGAGGPRSVGGPDGPLRDLGPSAAARKAKAAKGAVKAGRTDARDAARYWGGVSKAERTYKHLAAVDPEYARDWFSSKVHHLGGRYERFTGRTAPPVREPWSAGGGGRTAPTRPTPGLRSPDGPPSPPPKGGPPAPPDGPKPTPSGPRSPGEPGREPGAAPESGRVGPYTPARSPGDRTGPPPASPPLPTPGDRAKAAADAGRMDEARLWTEVGNAQSQYRWKAEHEHPGASPAQVQQARQQFVDHVRESSARYEAATGHPAPRFEPPWDEATIAPAGPHLPAGPDGFAEKSIAAWDRTRDGVSSGLRRVDGAVDKALGPVMRGPEALGEQLDKAFEDVPDDLARRRWWRRGEPKSEFRTHMDRREELRRRRHFRKED